MLAFWAHVAICIPLAYVATLQSFSLLYSFICLLPGVSMTAAAAAAALTQTCQVPSGPEAKVSMLATAQSGSLQPNPSQANRQLQFQALLEDASLVDAPSSREAIAAAAAPVSALLPSMRLQTTGKQLLPATGALLPIMYVQTTLPAPPSQQEGTGTAAGAVQDGPAAAATLHLPSARLPSLHTSASASLEVPARVSSELPVTGAPSPLGPAHTPDSSPLGVKHPRATLLSGQSQTFQSNGMSQTLHAQVSARPTCSMLVPPTQTTGIHSFFTQLPESIAALC